jgi:predicted DNA-binding transcriptional regulator YafY
MARIFTERKFHSSQKTIERKQRRDASPETITIEMRVARGRGLVRFIMSWLPDVEVVSPKEIREEVRQILLKGLKNF